MEKTCSKCGVQYIPDEKIKHRNWCRDCLRKYHRDNQRRRRLDPKTLEKERANARKYYRRYYQPGSEYRARKLVRRKLARAINKGDIVRPDYCSCCKKTCKPHGHHEDYSEPLIVGWLCKDCHAAIHRIR